MTAKMTIRPRDTGDALARAPREGKQRKRALARALDSASAFLPRCAACGRRNCGSPWSAMAASASPSTCTASPRRSGASPGPARGSIRSALRDSKLHADGDVYSTLLEAIAAQADTDIRIIVDILAGASAGGINAVFLGHAIATGDALDPLTDLWLDSADVDCLLAPGGNAMSRIAKLAAVPVAWALTQRSGTIDKTVEPAHRAEIKAKLANFVRAPWFAPPFGGPELTNLLLDAFDAMAEGAEGRAAAARLPAARPVRHRHRFPRLSRAAPPQFAARGDRDRASADPRLPGSGRRGAAARRPGRAGLRGARDRELPRRLPAIPCERARPMP